MFNSAVCFKLRPEAIKFSLLVFFCFFRSSWADQYFLLRQRRGEKVAPTRTDWRGGCRLRGDLWWAAALTEPRQSETESSPLRTVADRRPRVAPSRPLHRACVLAGSMRIWRATPDSRFITTQKGLSHYLT